MLAEKGPPHYVGGMGIEPQAKEKNWIRNSSWGSFLALKKGFWCWDLGASPSYIFEVSL